MNKPLILVVEDDRPVRNLIVTTLKSDCGERTWCDYGGDLP